MFRGIGSSVEKRRTALSTATAKNKSAESVVARFIIDTFGDAARYIELETRFEKGSLIIQTKNKIAAHEIMFRSSELYRKLKENDIVCERVVIR